MTTSTLFVWTGKGGPDWSSTSGTITNWQIPGGSNTIVPSSDTTLEAVAARRATARPRGNS